MLPGLTYDLSWRIPCVLKKNTYFAAVVRHVCKYLLGPFGLELKCDGSLLTLSDLIMAEKGMLKSSPITLQPISPFRPINICLMDLGTLVLSAYGFITVVVSS